MQIAMVGTAKGPLPLAALRVTDWYVTENNDDHCIKRRDYFVLTTDEFVRNDLDMVMKRWPQDVPVAAGSVGG